MLRIFDYTCEQGHVFDKLVRDEEKDSERHCPECGALSTRKISPVKIKADGCDPNNTRAWLKWEKDRMKRLKDERKKSYNES